VTCVHCRDDAVVKRGTIGKDAQQYWCKECETYFSDLTKTIFWQHRSGSKRYSTSSRRCDLSGAQIARDLDRDYEAVLNFVHKVQDVSGDVNEFNLYGDGSVILCTDGYTIYDDIEDKEGVDGHLAVTHSDTYVISDAHTNIAEKPAT
jgi:transposase-like protein